MNRTIASTLLFCAVYFSALNTASAILIETVPVGNPGNLADPDDGDADENNTTIEHLGAVSYAYRIGKFEVTNTQYVAFLNAVAATDTYELYHENVGPSPVGGIVRTGSPTTYHYQVKPDAIGQGSGGSDYTYANKPVTYIGFYEAARFANWMHNGQPTGPQNASTTEDGAYTFSGAQTVGSRNPGAKWFIPNENEWYKAAYYNPDTATYYDYATRTNAVPNNNLPSGDTGNSANFSVQLFSFPYIERTTGVQGYPLTDVGAYGLSKSPYGTFDQSGNVREYTEDHVTAQIVRGGDWIGFSYRLAASFRGNGPAYGKDFGNGFRVATIPEPSSLVLAGLGAAALILVARSRHRERKRGLNGGIKRDRGD